MKREAGYWGYSRKKEGGRQANVEMNMINLHNMYALKCHDEPSPQNE
jgi:hypothetical protein